MRPGGDQQTQEEKRREEEQAPKVDQTDLPGSRQVFPTIRALRCIEGETKATSRPIRSPMVRGIAKANIPPRYLPKRS